MGYFNLNSILYNLRKICKYLSFSLLIVAFIVIALLLMGKNVSAYGSNLTVTTLPSGVFSYLENTIEYQSGNYEYFVFQNSSSIFTITFVSKSQLSGDLKMYLVSDRPTYRFNQGFSYIQYSVNANGVYQDTGSNTSQLVSVWSSHYNSNGVFYWQSSFNAYTDDTYLTLLYKGIPVVPVIEEPYISMPNDNTDTYINGEFSDFMVIGGNDVEILHFFYTDMTEEYSGSSTVDLLLDENSPYYLNNFEDNHIYIIPKTIIPYLDNHEYYIRLRYVYNDVVYNEEPITWTTNFSERAIINDDIRAQDKMNQQLQDINNFFNNNNYNSGDIINNMPSSNEYISPTDSGIDSIFTALYNAFTTSNTQTVRFVIPFTNGQYIDIPSDLVSSRLPQIIITLIQSVYWFIICRFIIKDIASIAEKAKSGEILDDSSDGNIKTDLL